MQEARGKKGQRSDDDDVAAKDINQFIKGGVCAFDMGQNSNYAAVMDAQSKLRDEECASGMVQRSNYAAAMDA